MIDERKTSTVLIKFFFLVGLGFLFGWIASDKWALNKLAEHNVEEVLVVNGEKEGVDLSQFWEVWDTLHEKHVDVESFEMDKLVYGAIKGMVDAAGDDYSVYMDPEEAKDFFESLEGSLEGIGAELEVIEDRLQVVSPLTDSPAEKAGILPGDFIYKVGEEFTTNMTLFEAIAIIRGEKGSTVTLTIIREGVDEPFEVSIVRDTIEIHSVEMELLEGDVAYLSINQFNEKTNPEFAEEIGKLVLDEPNGVIIDLRFNGGGYLDSAVDIVSFFVESDLEVVTLKGRDSENVQYSHNSQKLLDVPVVVLVNEGSASASEIVAGAFQDLKRGIVMGEQSFGKGTVQELVDFGDSSLMRVTTDKWFTPDDRNIHEIGITPDVVVEFEEEDLENAFDRQKEEARKYLVEL